jgi:hypothetical protein
VLVVDIICSPFLPVEVNPGSTLADLSIETYVRRDSSILDVTQVALIQPSNRYGVIGNHLRETQVEDIVVMRREPKQT